MSQPSEAGVDEPELDPPRRPRASSRRLHVLAEGPGWTAVAKPPRLACHRSELVFDRHTLVQLARRQLGRDIHLVHRLDRAASGVLLLAHDPDTTRRLHAALHAPSAAKTYLAFVRGYFRWDDPVEIDTPMADDHGLIKDAASVVSCVGRSHIPRCSLLRVQPRTGRFHQVRRHVRDLGHPILGDGEHGDSRENRTWRDVHHLPRLGLHALHLDLPVDDDLVPGGRLKITCPPPADLAEIWRRLPWWDHAASVESALTLDPIPLWSPNAQ